MACFEVLTTLHAQAQSREKLLSIYDSATIHTVGKFYMKGGSRLKFNELKSEFNTPNTLPLYRKAKTDRILAGLFSVTSIAALVTGILVRKSNSTLGNVLSGSAIALNLGGLHFNKRSTEQADRAIWERNREILFGVRP